MAGFTKGDMMGTTLEETILMLFAMQEQITYYLECTAQKKHDEHFKAKILEMVKELTTLNHSDTVKTVLLCENCELPMDESLKEITRVCECVRIGDQ